ncbi:MAG: cytochrome P450 [Rhodospirillaceae bacterium]|nr:cytochrome P450 [Rhodospirillaceae bacterium]|tara:strand:- start:457 stop:1902 length:1446 start_codon:yes stop_codon:yes gene_type:complete
MTTHVSNVPWLSGGNALLGHSLEYGRDPVAFLQRGYQERGNIFSCKLGLRNFVVALGPENNKIFFDETDKRLSIREGYPFFLKMFQKEFYFFAPYEDYLKQRGMVRPWFKSEAMRSYVALMVEETEELFNQLGDEGVCDLIPTLGPLVMNIAAHAFLGRDFRRKLDDGFFNRFRDFSGGMEVVWPVWLPLPHLRRSQKARRLLDLELANWIKYRRDCPVDPPDFFQNLIESTLPDGSTVDQELAINIILLLVWAGHETTSGQIAWCLIDLLQHRSYLDEMYEETGVVMRDASFKEINWNAVTMLKKTEWAVKESERLHPVAYVMMRKVSEDLILSGHTIQKGTNVLAAPCVSHRMPEVFSDPHAYNPLRFGPDSPEGSTDVNRLIGFGGGIHRCLGVNFARLEMKMILAMLVDHYDMELLDKPEPISGTLTQWPKEPARVRYRRRHRDQSRVGFSVTRQKMSPDISEEKKNVTEGTCPVEH